MGSFSRAYTFLSLLLLSGSLLLSACAPRGETHSLDQVYTTAQSGYKTALSKAGNVSVSQELSKISSNIDSLLKATSAATLDETAEVLAAIAPKASATSRISMNEIAMQYKMLSEGSVKGQVNPAAVKLLAARTYFMLTSELETKKFSL